MDLSKNFTEIERKFLLRDVVPSSLAIRTIPVQRYYLYADAQAEIRIQRKGEDHYELESKVADAQSPLLRWSMKADLTAREFETLREGAIGNPIHYLKHDTDVPGIAIKEYLDQLAGLAIVEAEFADLSAAQEFRPSPSWIGAEITNVAYARDSGLIRVVDFAEIAAQLPMT